jgi:hypothetical protein
MLAPGQRYVTWRLPDRQFTKVHLVAEAGRTVCGKPIPRLTGAPQPPIPETTMCPTCASRADD